MEHARSISNRRPRDSFFEAFLASILPFLETPDCFFLHQALTSLRSETIDAEFEEFFESASSLSLPTVSLSDSLKQMSLSLFMETQTDSREEVFEDQMMMKESQSQMSTSASRIFSSSQQNSSFSLKKSGSRLSSGFRLKQSGSSTILSLSKPKPEKALPLENGLVKFDQLETFDHRLAFAEEEFAKTTPPLPQTMKPVKPFHLSLKKPKAIQNPPDQPKMAIHRKVNDLRSKILLWATSEHPEMSFPLKRMTSSSQSNFKNLELYISFEAALLEFQKIERSLLSFKQIHSSPTSTKPILSKLKNFLFENRDLFPNFFAENLQLGKRLKHCEKVVSFLDRFGELCLEGSPRVEKLLTIPVRVVLTDTANARIFDEVQVLLN